MREYLEVLIVAGRHCGHVVYPEKGQDIISFPAWDLAQLGQREPTVSVHHYRVHEVQCCSQTWHVGLPTDHEGDPALAAFTHAMDLAISEARVIP